MRFIPNTRLKSVLVISSRPEYLRKAEGWLERIDMAGQATEQQVNVYHVQNRAVGDLAALLQKVYTAQANGRTSTGQPGGGCFIRRRCAQYRHELAGGAGRAASQPDQSARSRSADGKCCGGG